MILDFHSVFISTKETSLLSISISFQSSLASKPSQHGEFRDQWEPLSQNLRWTTNTRGRNPTHSSGLCIHVHSYIHLYMHLHTYHKHPYAKLKKNHELNHHTGYSAYICINVPFYSSVFSLKDFWVVFKFLSLQIA